ncbi:MAG: hypothetical protein ACOYXC_07035 [Candidatus Rifleibacteriota bacterium]
MFKHPYNRFLVMLAILFLPAFSVVAQQDLKLNLKNKTSSKFVPAPRSGEFKLSLDSQLLETNLSTPEIDDQSITSIEAPALDLKRFNLIDGFTPEVSGSNSDAEDRRFSSTLTLTTGYSDLAAEDPELNRLRLEKQLGKFKILGEIEQQRITRIPLPEKSPGFSASANTALTRASIINSGMDDNDAQNKTSALASRYYLEAIYSFKPTVQGKLSYRRSMIDTIESEEELQFEGIVEANRNIMIKAGYNNETRPEVNEPKATKDSKVWTEFILKF